MIDSHTHLDSCKPPNDELVAAALEAGVTKLVTVGTGPESNRTALQAAERFEGVYAAIGHHPNDATGFTDRDFEDLRTLARHERCVAIGETGLDYFRDYAPREDQERAFRAQIALARELDKPLVIHTRAAEEDTIRMLSEEAADLRVILHCFSMGDHVDECLTHPNWWFSFAGNVTYPSAQPLRDAALKIPSSRLLVETDAPYLTPQVVRKERNQPAFVAHTARAVAIERRESYDDFERAVEATAADLFRWS